MFCFYLFGYDYFEFPTRTNESALKISFLMIPLAQATRTALQKPSPP
jgi:hypothetical protein